MGVLALLTDTLTWWYRSPCAAFLGGVEAPCSVSAATDGSAPVEDEVNLARPLPGWFISLLNGVARPGKRRRDDSSTLARADAPMLDRVLVPPGEWRKFVCATCSGRVLNGPHEWQVHLQSRSHKRLASRARRTEARAASRPAVADSPEPHPAPAPDDSPV